MNIGPIPPQIVPGAALIWFSGVDGPNYSPLQLSSARMPPTHVIISTHTTRHLRATLLGVAIQNPCPATVTVSIDNDKPDVRELCIACSREFDLPLIVASRPWPREVRVGQVRNNGVRALLANPHTKLAESDWLHFLDGDSVMPAGMLAESVSVREDGDLLIGGRVLLTESQTDAFDTTRFARGESVVDLTPEQLAERAERHSRYTRQLWLKKFGFVKMHKPKVLGANHACTLAMYRKVDGYDETFLGAWREDDDFGRRVYLARGKGRVAVKKVCVYHLWHPLNPQKRENWSELPDSRAGSAQKAWLPRAGLATPSPQETVRACRFESGRESHFWEAISPARSL